MVCALNIREIGNNIDIISRDVAVKNYQKALKLDPNHENCVRSFKMLIKLYTKCLELDKYNNMFNSILYSNQAMAKFKLQQYKSAKKDLNQAIMLNDQYGKVIYIYIYIYIIHRHM